MCSRAWVYMYIYCLIELQAANIKRNENENKRDRLIISQGSQQQKDYQHSQIGQQLEHQV